MFLRIYCVNAVAAPLWGALGTAHSAAGYKIRVCETQFRDSIDYEVLPFSFSIGQGTAWFFGSSCSCVKFHSNGWISLRLNITRIRRVTSSPG